MVLCGGAIDEVEPRAELDASDDDGVENRDDVVDVELKRLAPLPLLSGRAQDEDATGVISACVLVPRVLFFGGSPFMSLVRASGLLRSLSSLS